MCMYSYVYIYIYSYVYIIDIDKDIDIDIDLDVYIGYRIHTYSALELCITDFDISEAITHRPHPDLRTCDDSNSQA